MKKTIAMVLALSMGIALLAGCGSNGEGSNSDTAKSVSSEAQAADASEDSGTEAKEEQAGQDQSASEAGQSGFPENSVSMPLNKYSETWDCPNSGFSVEVPEFLRDYKGQFFPVEYGETGSGSGIFEGYIQYLARTDEEMEAFDTFVIESGSIDSNDTAAVTAYQNKVADFSEKISVITVLVLGIKNDLSFDNVMESDYSAFPVAESGEIGRAGKYNFYYVIPDYTDYMDGIEERLSEEMLADLNKALENAKDLLPYISVKEPAESAGVPEIGDTLSFDTTDLEGNPISSAELFAGHKVTMINLWATWCGPCVNELAQLEELNGELAGKECQIVGICLDSNGGASVIAQAKSILDGKGVTYVNLVSTEEILGMFPVQAVPTSFFVDSEGKVLTEPVIGADFDSYSQRIEEALQALEN